jgi:hypothetical protein
VCGENEQASDMLKKQSDKVADMSLLFVEIADLVLI